LKSSFRRSFQRDLRRVHDEDILSSIRQVILDVEAAVRWSDVPAIKKIRGSSNAFRIRIGDYRIGLFIETDAAEFVRVLPRRVPQISLS
jgi:mRNA interferase RelE/StbE